MSNHKLNIHYRGSPWGSGTQQHAYCLRYAHSQHIESHLGKKQPQAKIPIAFLFSQLHFNNVTSDAFFYGGHLVIRNKRCAVQNQEITLNKNEHLVISTSWLKPIIMSIVATLVFGSVIQALRFVRIMQHFSLVYLILSYVYFIIVLGGYMESLCGKLQL